VLGLSLALIVTVVPRALAADTGDDPFSDFGSPGQQEDVIQTQTVQRSPGDEAFGGGSPDIEGDVTGGAWQPPDQGSEGWTASLPAAAQDDLTVTGGAADRALAGQLDPSQVEQTGMKLAGLVPMDGAEVRTPAGVTGDRLVAEVAAPEAAKPNAGTPAQRATGGQRTQDGTAHSEWDAARHERGRLALAIILMCGRCAASLLDPPRPKGR